MDGVLNVHKPTGPTSHDVVDEVRRIFGQKRVGHAGTLDPMASGVLVVCLGKATRVVEYLMGAPKEYRARMALGVTTDSQDSTGSVIEERNASSITREMVEEAARAFVGKIEQIPPMVSAVKHEGKRLYKLAREGKTVDRPPRRITVHSIEVAAFSPSPIPNCELSVRCSSGTYIRTLCADIGERLGCGAHMSMLERTAVGRFRIEDAITPDDLRATKSRGELEGAVIAISDALSDMPAVTLDAGDEARALHGLAAQCVTSADDGATVRMLSPDGGLIGLGRVSRAGGEVVIKPQKVLAEIPRTDN